jgi:hypothetical protein
MDFSSRCAGVLTDSFGISIGSVFEGIVSPDLDFLFGSIRLNQHKPDFFWFLNFLFRNSWDTYVKIYLKITFVKMMKNCAYFPEIRWSSLAQFLLMNGSENC